MSSRTIAVWTLTCCVVLTDCAGGPDESAPGLKPFPSETTAADFPGKTYPAHQGAIPRPGKISGPVWVVAVDGATWKMIRPQVAAGLLPNFATLIDGSAHGTLVAEEPTISPALWATIATGMPRLRHGIVNFLEKIPGSYKTVPTGPGFRRSPALWELVGSSGGRSAVISWFGSHPAEKIPGHYISKGFDPENLQLGQVHPPAFAAVLRERARVKMRRRDVEDIVKSNFLRDTLLEDARAMSALRVVAEDSSHDLVLCYFSGVDVVQHISWRHMDPDTPSFPGDDPPDARRADLIPAYYRYIDHNLGEILELVPDDATLMVLSDHGGGPLDVQDAFRLRLEVLLEQLGFLDGTDGPALAIDEFYRHDKRIWLNLEGVQPAGFIPLQQAEAQAAELQGTLARLTTDQGDPLFASIRNHTRETTWLPGDPALTVRFSTAALLTPTALDGERSYDFSAVRLRRTDVSGTHRPEGILILRGPGIEPGELPRAANHYNVAPTVLYLLGLPQDARMLALAPEDGGVLEAAIRSTWLDRYPVRAIPEYPGTDRSALLVAGPGSGHPLPDADPSIDASMERMRSLGYVN